MENQRKGASDYQPEQVSATPKGTQPTNVATQTPKGTEPTDMAGQSKGLTEAKSATDLIYEDSALKLTVVKAAHLQEKKFRLQDHMFHLRLETKTKSFPLLSNVLKFLHLAFLFILKNVRKFYNPLDANIAFLTIYQGEMLNAINSGGFLLHDEITSTEMVDRVLGLFNQYLISHKALELNKTFKVYLKILSAAHSKLKSLPSRRKQKSKLNVKIGGNEKVFTPWAIDVPQTDIFKDKCLLTSTILAIAQHNYFYSNKVDCTFKNMQRILNKDPKKIRYASKLILEKLHALLIDTKIPLDGPYELLNTITILSKYYNCQFFVFEGSIKRSKLVLRYPENFDSSLKPIFLFKPFDSNHVVFIRNINSYFAANGKTCLWCKKFFKTSSYIHFCKQSNNSCFACHRFLQKPETYFHSNLSKLYCDSSLINNSTSKCSLCNLNLKSSSCAQQHKRLCYSKGYFGFKCDLCSSFTYRKGNLTSKELKEKHVCGTKTCKFCFQICESDHLCKLIEQKVPKFHVSLGFLHFHVVPHFPTVAIAYIEDNERGVFLNQLICENSLLLKNCFNPETLCYDYFRDISITDEEKKHKITKAKNFLDQTIVKRRMKTKEDCFEKEFLTFILNEKLQGITFVVSDEDNLGMVIFSSYVLLALKTLGIKPCTFAC